MTLSYKAFSPLVTVIAPAADGNYTDAYRNHLIDTLHDIECPPGHGWVAALLGPDYMGGSNAAVSVQLMADAGAVGQGAPLGLQCWHIGGPGNQLSDGLEQAGYACFTRAMWLGTEKVGATYTRPDGQVVTWTAQNNADMAAQLELVARTFAELHRVKGTPLRWLTLAELRQAHDDYEAGRAQTVTGFCRHRDWTDADASNTSHHDTGDFYPTDVLMAKAVAYANPTPPAPAQPPEDTLLDADKTWIADTVKAEVGAALAPVLAALADVLTPAYKVPVRDALTEPADQEYTIAEAVAKLINYTSSQIQAQQHTAATALTDADVQADLAASALTDTDVQTDLQSALRPVLAQLDRIAAAVVPPPGVIPPAVTT